MSEIKRILCCNQGLIFKMLGIKLDPYSLNILDNFDAAILILYWCPVLYGCLNTITLFHRCLKLIENIVLSRRGDLVAQLEDL